MSGRARAAAKAWSGDDRWSRWLNDGGAAAPFEQHWTKFRELDAEGGAGAAPPAVWRPDDRTARESNAARLMARARVSDWRQLHAWSVRDREGFWKTAIEKLGVVFHEPPERVLDLSRGVEDARWLPGASFNVVESCFRGAGHATAILSACEGSRRIRRTTLGELREMSARVAAGLRARGLEPGDAVALYMPMTPECVAAYLGVVWAGLRVVSVADSFPAAEVARRLEMGGAKAVITVDAFVRAGRRLALYDVVREAGAPQAVVISGGDAPELRPGDVHWWDLLAAGSRFAPVPTQADAVTNVLFSSGTTAAPKAIPWTQLTPLKAATDARYHHDVRKGDIVAWPTNVGWMMGPWLIYAALLNRAAMALYEGAPSGPGFARFVADARVTMLGVVPSLVRAWRAALEGTDATDWRRIRVLSSTGEPSRREDMLWLMSRVGYRAPVVEYCGGTEIGGGYVTGTVLRPASPSIFTTPALGLDFELLDIALPDGEARPVADGETGEVFLVPPSIGLSQTLLNGDHHEVYYAGCPRGPGGETLRRHGDALLRLPSGAFRARGRVDDTMNLGGIKVSSVEIEQVAQGLDDVREAAAVSTQAGGEGPEQLVLFVVPEGAPERQHLKTELDRTIAQRLNPLFKVHDVVLVDALPRTASQKLVRRELRARYAGVSGSGA